MVFGEKVRRIPTPERNWVLGSLPIKEVLTWKNLGIIWNANNKFDSTIDIVLKKGYAVIDIMVAMGCRHGGLNSKVATKLWRSIALPHLLYGCELWYLTMKQFSKLEKIQNIFCRIFWYEIWDFAPMNSNIVVDVIRLLCDSLKIDGIRIENYNCLHSFYCSFCQRCVINPVHHALLYCMNTANQRQY